jgi:hypothetical protein
VLFPQDNRPRAAETHESGRLFSAQEAALRPWGALGGGAYGRAKGISGSGRPAALLPPLLPQPAEELGRGRRPFPTLLTTLAIFAGNALGERLRTLLSARGATRIEHATLGVCVVLSVIGLA